MRTFLVTGGAGFIGSHIAHALVARGDTNGLANLAYSQCRWLSNESKQTCYENYFVALSDSGRVRLALGGPAMALGDASD